MHWSGKSGKGLGKALVHQCPSRWLVVLNVYKGLQKALGKHKSTDVPAAAQPVAAELRFSKQFLTKQKHSDKGRKQKDQLLES